MSYHIRGFDREPYEEGYEDGYKDGIERFRQRILNKMNIEDTKYDILLDLKSWIELKTLVLFAVREEEE